MDSGMIMLNQCSTDGLKPMSTCDQPYICLTNQGWLNVVEYLHSLNIFLSSEIGIPFIIDNEDMFVAKSPVRVINTKYGESSRSKGVMAVPFKVRNGSTI